MKGKFFIILISLLTLSSCSTPSDQSASDLDIKGYAIINNRINNEKFMAQIYDAPTNKLVEEIPIEANGIFEIPKMSSGTYSIRAVNANGIPYKSSSINFAVENNKINIQDNIKLIITNTIKEELVITGTVDFSNEINFADIKVLLSKEEGGKPIRSFTVDSIGVFTIKDVEDGIYYIAAEAPDEVMSEWIEIQVADKTLQNNEEIILKLGKNDVSDM